MADLVSAEIAFTADVRSGGRKTYVVDSVALSEDELVLLHRKGALTPTGIRHYLVYRNGDLQRCTSRPPALAAAKESSLMIFQNRGNNSHADFDPVFRDRH